MSRCSHFLPGFKVTCILVGSLDILMAGSLFAKGLMNSMAEFKVPDQILSSPHYYDAIFWVYSHMIIIGSVIVLAGIYAKEFIFRKNFSRLMFLAHAFYAYLDFRSSDSALGNGLYQGPASIIPAIFGVILTVLFLHLSFCNKALER